MTRTRAYPAKIVNYCPTCASESTHLGDNRHQCGACGLLFTVALPFAADRKPVDESGGADSLGPSDIGSHAERG